MDNSFVASHTPATADANHVFTLENGMLKVSIPDNAGNGTDYELTDGVLSVSPGFTGTITAEYEFATNPTREIDFEYDHNGLRTRKKVVENGVTTTYDYTLHGKLITHLTKRVVEETGAETTETLHFFYDAQSRPAFVEYEGEMYRYIHNLQGDIVAIVDSAGNPVVEYKYDAWGKPISAIDTSESGLGSYNPFKYRSYSYDDKAQIYYLYSRCYNPAWGKFLNGDIILSRGVLNGNLFQYCENNSVCRGDKAGKDSYYVVLNIYEPAEWNNKHGHYDLSIISKENPKKGYTFSYGPILDGDEYSDEKEYPARYTVWLTPMRGDDRVPSLRCILYDGLPEKEFQGFKDSFTAIDEKKATVSRRFLIDDGDYSSYCVSKLRYCGPGVSYLVKLIIKDPNTLSNNVRCILDMFEMSQCDVTGEFKAILCSKLFPYIPKKID